MATNGEKKNLVGIGRCSKKEEEERKMPYYEFIVVFRGRYKSLFGFEYSILKHPSWAGITVPSVPFPGSSGPPGDGHS